MERIPILRMGKYLLVTIQVDMHDRLAMQLQEDLTARIAAVQARGVLIDISALKRSEAFLADQLAVVDDALDLGGRYGGQAVSHGWRSRSARPGRSLPWRGKPSRPGALGWRP